MQDELLSQLSSQLEHSRTENTLLKSQMKRAYASFEVFKVKAADDQANAVQEAAEQAAAEEKRKAGAMVSQATFDALSEELK